MVLFALLEVFEVRHLAVHKALSKIDDEVSTLLLADYVEEFSRRLIGESIVSLAVFRVEHLEARRVIVQKLIERPRRPNHLPQRYDLGFFEFRLDVDFEELF